MTWEQRQRLERIAARVGANCRRAISCEPDGYDVKFGLCDSDGHWEVVIARFDASVLDFVEDFQIEAMMAMAVAKLTKEEP